MREVFNLVWPRDGFAGHASICFRTAQLMSCRGSPILAEGQLVSVT